MVTRSQNQTSLAHDGLVVIETTGEVKLFSCLTLVQGEHAGNSDADGHVFISHGLEGTPDRVYCQSNYWRATQFQVLARDTTTLTVVCYQPNGTLNASTWSQFEWQAWKINWMPFSTYVPFSGISFDIS